MLDFAWSRYIVGHGEVSQERHYLRLTPCRAGALSGRTLPFGDYGAGTRAARGLDVIKNTNILILHISRFYYSRNDELQLGVSAVEL